jgi:integrase
VVDVGLVMKAIEPIWTVKPETAGRVRGRIESILDWATTRGYRTGENPARWRGHLENLLPARSKVRRVEHYAALPYAAIGAFMAQLRQSDGPSARALAFLILTAARTGEVIGARWDEINVAERIWIVSADRMKAGREHRVPLSNAALAIVEKMAAIRAGEYVFPGGKAGRPMSNMALLMLLRRMGRGDLTAHGFRSTFRDWAAERANFPAEVAEMALAHTVSDKVEAAYRRGDLFEKRREIMAAWANFIDREKPVVVVPMRRQG